MIGDEGVRVSPGRLGGRSRRGGRGRSACRLPRRRNESRRPDATRRRRTASVGRRFGIVDRRRPSWIPAACWSVQGSATATWPLISASAGTFRCCRRRCCPVHPANCGTWPPSAGTCCSAPVVCTSRTPASPATSGRTGRGARPGPGSIATSGCSAPARPAWRPIRPTWRSRWPQSDAVVLIDGPNGQRRLNVGRVLSVTRRRPDPGHHARPRGTHHGDRAAAAVTAAANLRLSQGAGPGVIRVRGGFRCGRHRRRRTVWSATSGWPSALSRPDRGGPAPPSG